MSTLRCAMCRAELVGTRHGDTEAWVCPTGHGVALTTSGSPGVEPALSVVWARAEAAAAGIRHCPRCDGEMAVLSVGQGAAAKADACALCEVLWLDSLELAGLQLDDLDAEALVELAVSTLRSRQAEQLVG